MFCSNTTHASLSSHRAKHISREDPAPVLVLRMADVNVEGENNLHDGNAPNPAEQLSQLLFPPSQDGAGLLLTHLKNMTLTAADMGYGGNAELFLTILEFSTTQMGAALLNGRYGIVCIPGPLWEELQYVYWPSLGEQETMDLLPRAGQEWEDMARQVLDLLRGDVNVEWLRGMRERVQPIEDLAAWLMRCMELVSDVAAVLRARGEVGELSVTQLKDVPSRHKSIQRILDVSPATDQLPVYVRATLATLPESERECAICTRPWDAEAICAALPVTELRWLAACQNGVFLDVWYGCEGVPLKLPCGHVFCAECLQSWLDVPCRRGCPYRDDEYGVVRDKSVALAEKMVELFRGE